MSLPSEQLDPDRLFDAADAVLRAVVEVANEFDGVYVYPTRLMGSPLQPECLCEFTQFEVQQGTEFLVRLGMLPAEAPAAE